MFENVWVGTTGEGGLVRAEARYDGEAMVTVCLGIWEGMLKHF